MIVGVWDKNRPGGTLKHELGRAMGVCFNGRDSHQPHVWAMDHLAMCHVPLGIETLDEGPQPVMSKDQSMAVVVDGKIYNIAEIRGSLGADAEFRTTCSGEALIHLYEKKGEEWLDGVNGKFSFALWDGKRRRLLLGRDHFGIESLYYSGDAERLVFGSSLRVLLASGLAGRELNHAAVLQYLLYCYNPADETFVHGVRKVAAGHFLRIDEAGVRDRRYWNLSFGQVEERPEQAYCEEIPGLIEDAIRIRLDAQRVPGVLLSGGTASSTIVSLASGMCDRPIHTFSFRCEGRSYDESRYARKVAQLYGTHHTEIPYHPDSLSLVSRATGLMDEPFCDIGIEIGTYLVGQAAEGKVSYVLSGEGGDELFGGHPVYTADKLARLVDRVPRAIVKPVAAALQRIPDSDQKKNFQVKVKRFAYSLAFPRELLSHRWRVYYTPQELRELCTQDFLVHCDMERLFEGMYKYAREADGPDQLSRSLYSDYYTLVNFYLRRLGVLQGFSIESRLPLLDYRLVEYAARIPSRLKLKGLSDTKYIYKKALESVLPREILYDRPKLGHSVPMKNWLRENKNVRDWVADTLSDAAITRRGLFHPGAIRKLRDQHLRMQENHSHRLWGLLVLELWLKATLDTDRATLGGPAFSRC